MGLSFFQIIKCECVRRTNESGCMKMAAAFFGNFDNDLTIFQPVFMEKGYVCQKFKFTIWNVHGKKENFLWNNHMEKETSFVYDEYNRHEMC